MIAIIKYCYYIELPSRPKEFAVDQINIDSLQLTWRKSDEINHYIVSLFLLCIHIHNYAIQNAYDHSATALLICILIFIVFNYGY